ncbi:MAG: hypothetical protein OEM38_01175 [Gammaproteobacteria bacterium]|nr:hypothetical protein [Gammaproteobacteria bacterium]
MVQVHGEIKDYVMRLSHTVLLFLFISNSLNAETITELSMLDFGTIAITDNTAAYTLRLRYTGQVIKDPQIIMITPGTPAEYFLSGFLPSTLLTINITSIPGVTYSPQSGNPSNQQFTISNFDYLPLVTTTAAGELSIFVGATLTTSGVGTYEDTPYYTTLNINVSY